MDENELPYFPFLPGLQTEAAEDDGFSARPDLGPVQEQEACVWEQPDIPTVSCPCCGADIPENPFPGYICPMCWWEIDPFTADEDAPSDQNHGLSLAEARLNFRVFGICDPWLKRDTDETE